VGRNRTVTRTARRQQPFMSGVSGDVVTKKTSVLEHGQLLSLAADDHLQYATTASGRSAYRAERLNKSILNGFGITGGGLLDADRTLAVDAVDDPGVESRVLKSTTAGKLSLRGLTLRGDLLPYAPDAANIGSSSYPFLTGHISEMYGTRFVEETVQVNGGRRLVSKSSAILDTALGAADTTVTVKASQLWAEGDVLILRDIGKVEYMAITGGSGLSWTVTRNLDGSGANTWESGSIIVNRGKSGDGFIEEQGGSNYALSLWNVTGSGYSDVAELMRFGNLSNWNGYPSTDLPGVGIGDSERWIAFDKTYGLRLNSPVMIGGNLGLTTDALLYCAFDGPKPYNIEPGGSPIGHLGQTPTVYGAPVYREGRFGKAVELAEATTNLFSAIDPAFESDTTLSGWLKANFTTAIRSGDIRGLFGARTAKLVTDTSVGYLEKVIAVSGAAYALSVYARRADGQPITSSDVWLRFNYANATPVVIDVGNKWYRLEYSAAGNNSTTRFGVVVRAGLTVYLDGIQLEQKAYSTPFTVTSRVGCGLTYSGTLEEVYDQITIRAWIRPGSSSSSGNRTLLHGSDGSGNHLIFRLNAAGNLVAYWNTAAGTGSSVVAPGAWSQVVMTYNGAAVVLYHNGVQVLSAPMTGALAGGIIAFMTGCDASSVNTASLNGRVDDLMVSNRPWSAVEVLADYNAGAPLNIRRGPFDLYLGGGGSGGWLIGNGDGLAGYDSAGVKQAWFGSDGKFYAGGEEAWADTNGYTVKASFLETQTAINAYKFTDGTNTLGGLYASAVAFWSTITVKSTAPSGKIAYAALESRSLESSSETNVSAIAEGGSPYTMKTANIRLQSSPNLIGTEITITAEQITTRGTLVQEGSLEVTTGFGCNGATPKTKATVNAARSTTLAATDLDTAAEVATQLNASNALLNQLRTLLINNGQAQ
jgi:hypothetical protein